MDLITITAVDKNSSDNQSKTFSTTFQGSESPTMLKSMVENWEKDLPYTKYELVTPDFIEDYSDEIQEVLEELEIEN